MYTHRVILSRIVCTKFIHATLLLVSIILLLIFSMNFCYIFLLKLHYIKYTPLFQKELLEKFTTCKQRFIRLLQRKKKNRKEEKKKKPSNPARHCRFVYQSRCLKFRIHADHPLHKNSTTKIQHISYFQTADVIRKLSQLFISDKNINLSHKKISESKGGLLYNLM